MGVFTYGISTVKFGAKGALDVMGTTLAALGKTAEGSAEFTLPEPSTTEFRSEEDDAPVFQIKNQDKPAMLKLDIMDCDSAALLAIFGGTVTGTTPKIWSPPLASATIELSCELTTRGGTIIKIPRGAITGTINAKLSRNNLFNVTVTVEALKPASTTLEPFNISLAT